MTKIALADPRVNDLFSNEFHAHSAGLVIGQRSELDKFLIVHVAPFKEPFNLESEESPSSTKSVVLDEDFDVESLVEHGIQASKLLPGGIQVIGLFIVGDPNKVFGTKASPLKCAAKSINKHYRVNESMNETTSEMLIVCICEESSKVTCKLFDVEDHGGSLKNVEWKYCPSSMSWSKLHTTFALDFVCPVSISKTNKPFYNQLKSCLEPFFTSIVGARFLLNNVIRLNEDRLVSKHETDHLFSIDLFPDMVLPEDENVISIVDSSTMLKIQGTIYSIGYVHPKASVEFAVKVIKNDICRSLLDRFELHCDSIVNDDNKALVLLHEPPRRVLAPLTDSDIFVGDYLFPGEEDSVCLTNLEHILNLEIGGEDLVSYREYFIGE